MIETEFQDIRILSFLVIQKILAISEGLFFAPNSVADTSPTWKIQWNPALRSPRWHGHFFWSPGKNRHTFSCKKKNPLQYGHFFWAHSVTVLTRFHCTAKYTQYTVDRKKLFKVVTSHQVVWIVLVKYKQTPPGFAAHLQLHSLFSQRSEWTLSNPQNFAFSLFPVSPGYYHDYSRSKRNRRRWLCKPCGGGGGVNKVHYGLCEKGEWEYAYFNKVCELESP